jgi:hypothetical protein
MDVLEQAKEHVDQVASRMEYRGRLATRFFALSIIVIMLLWMALLSFGVWCLVQII